MSYSRNEKALYLSVAIGTAIMIIIIGINHNYNSNIVTFSMSQGTFHAVKVPLNPNEQIELDGYKFRWLPQDIVCFQDPGAAHYLYPAIEVEVTTPDGQDAYLMPCNSFGYQSMEYLPVLYEGERFGYAYNWRQEQGYFIVRVEDGVRFTNNKPDSSNTPFTIPENLDLEEMAKFTAADKARALQIFLADSEVQRIIDGKPYELEAIGVGTPDLSEKPPKFYITINMDVGDDKVLSGSVDLENGKVVNVNESPVTKLG